MYRSSSDSGRCSMKDTTGLGAGTGAAGTKSGAGAAGLKLTHARAAKPSPAKKPRMFPFPRIPSASPARNTLTGRRGRKFKVWYASEPMVEKHQFYYKERCRTEATLLRGFNGYLWNKGYRKNTNMMAKIVPPPTVIGKTGHLGHEPEVGRGTALGDNGCRIVW